MKRTALRAFVWAVPPVATIAVIAWHGYGLPVEASRDLAWLLFAFVALGAAGAAGFGGGSSPWLVLTMWLMLLVVSTSGSELAHRLWPALVGVLGYDLGAGAVALARRAYGHRRRDDR